MNTRTPNLPIPEPLRALEPGTWAHSTVTVRLGEIARRVRAENQLAPEAVDRLRCLISELGAGPIRPLHEPFAADREDWKAYSAPYLGKSWLTVPWFFAETYFYRRILEATGYFQPGAGQGIDPFAYQKSLGLAASIGKIRSLSNQVAAFLRGTRPLREALEVLLEVDLWGNRADLSLWPATASGAGGKTGLERAEGALLANDGLKVADYLLGVQGPIRVNIVCDNAGFELGGDLLLGYFLLASGIARQLVLQVKYHPTFVSDATGLDVRKTLAALAGDGDTDLQQQAESMLAALESGDLQISAPPFWTSPLSGWEMPDPLWDRLAMSDLVIVKGDANYRRLLGDRHWPYTASFADIMGYSPAPLLALRTLKAEVAAGLTQERIAELNENEPDWMTNGRWGVIQFVIPGRN